VASVAPSAAAVGSSSAAARAAASRRPNLDHSAPTAKGLVGPGVRACLAHPWSWKQAFATAHAQSVDGPSSLETRSIPGCTGGRSVSGEAERRGGQTAERMGGGERRLIRGIGRLLWLARGQSGICTFQRAGNLHTAEGGLARIERSEPEIGVISRCGGQTVLRAAVAEAAGSHTSVFARDLDS
jgi:hypothetical protein